MLTRNQVDGDITTQSIGEALATASMLAEWLDRFCPEATFYNLFLGSDEEKEDYDSTLAAARAWLEGETWGS